MLNKTSLKRVIVGIFVISWMTVVFIFSSQDGAKSNNTSGSVIYFVDTKINSNSTNNKTEQNTSNNKNTSNNTSKDETDKNTTQKYKYSAELQKVVRKNAHCFLYTIGGVVISVFFYAFTLNKKEVITNSLLTGVLYALSDEMHQYFVPGRTSSVFDVGIDTAGVIIGILLTMLVLKLTRCEIKRKIKYLK